MSNADQPRFWERPRFWLYAAGVVILTPCCLENFGGVLVFLAQFGGALLLGWARFLYAAVQRVRVVPEQATVWVIGVVMLTGLCHTLCRNWVPTWTVRSTLRTVGLVLVLFVAGIALISTVHQIGWMVTTQETLIGHRLGDAPHRMMAASSLKQLGVALEKHEEAHHHMPAGYVADARGEPLFGWPVALLPFLDEGDLFKRIDRTKPWNDPANADLFRKPLRPFVSPWGEKEADGWGLNHYAANGSVISGDRPRKLAEFNAVGAGNVVAIGEAAGNYQPWGHPLQSRDLATPLGQPDGFGSSASSGTVRFLMLDGSVRTIRMNPPDPEFRDILKASTRP
jgi:hypothetical protein